MPPCECRSGLEIRDLASEENAQVQRIIKQFIVWRRGCQTSGRARGNSGCGGVIMAYNLIVGLFREREPSIDLPYRIDVALTVIYDVGDFPGAVIRIDLRAVESFFRRRYAEGSGEQIEACVFAAPFAPLMHCVEDRRVAKTGERKVARWFDLMDDRALVDKPEIEIEYVVADEEIAVHGQLPKVFDNLGFFALEHLDFGAHRRLDGVTEAKDLRRGGREAELLDEVGLV